ncbi:MAG TPA: DUF4255 domain-containing protein [Bacteroidetes bacterium]|nr:DUF4255 domain-containing protein [Bacteroidota bacterium]
MIHTALSFLTNELNEYLKLRTGTPGVDRVFLTSVATESDGVVIPDKSVGVSLINIEEDRVYKDQRTSVRNSEGNVEYLNPEIKLNLYILISANFQDKLVSDSSDDYVEGLKQLSHIISFFQAKNVFTQDNSPALAKYDPDIQKLVVELYSYSFEQLYNFWSVVGTKYLPSVLYKVRVISFQEKEFFDTASPVEKIGIDSKTKGK